MRINKYLSECGFCSRRRADSLIEKGSVYVNGIVATLGSEVNETDEVMVFNKIVKPAEKIYLMLNKPQGYLSATKDYREKTVIDLIDIDKRVFPIGRLDKNSEGLLILSNDGEIFNKLVHPRSEIWKKYYVETFNPITPNDIKNITEGMRYLADNFWVSSLPAKVEKLSGKKCYVEIREGKKREIRRIFEALGNTVTYLQRLSVGKLHLGSLALGKFRHLKKEEVDWIKSL